MLMQLAACFHVLRSEWPVWQIMEMENQIQSQEQEASRSEMVVNESERCVFVVLILRIQIISTHIHSADSVLFVYISQ